MSSSVHSNQLVSLTIALSIFFAEFLFSHLHLFQLFITSNNENEFHVPKAATLKDSGE